MTVIRNSKTAVVIGLICLAVLVVSIWLIVSVSGDPGVNIRLELMKGAISLLSALIITAGVASLLALRTRRHAEGVDRLNALVLLRQELKGAYEQMAVCRTRLRASLSARTFEAQFPEILGSRARLQRMERDEILNEAELSDVKKSVEGMVEFTRGATKFYTANYAGLVKGSLMEEFERDRIRREGDVLPLNLPVLKLDELEEAEFLRVLTSERCIWRTSAFYLGYDGAKKGVEREIKKMRDQIG
jgi:hypothetical protein